MVGFGCVVNSAVWLFTAILVLLIQTAKAVPGEYKSLQILKNKWLPTYLEKFEQVMTLEHCTRICVKDKVCTGFAYSKSYSTCLLYEIKPGTPPVGNSGYDIYIRMYDESEGYYIYETGYIRLMLKREPIIGARQNCSDQGGSLVAVRRKDLNDLLYGLLVKYNIWHAYIGASDEQEEGVWKWPDGGKVGYEKWDWNGKWERRDRNCAVILNGFENAPWKHFNCKRPNYYFCQIPMF